MILPTWILEVLQNSFYRTYFLHFLALALLPDQQACETGCLALSDS
jgi:hypothetical protein